MVLWTISMFALAEVGSVLLAVARIKSTKKQKILGVIKMLSTMILIWAFGTVSLMLLFINS